MTANFLAMPGVEAQVGRTFAEDEGGNGTNVVLLSDHLWRGQFNAGPNILGKAVNLDGVEQTVIGVLPPHFRFPDVQLEPDIYAPLGLIPTGAQTTKGLTLVCHWPVAARVSARQAQAEMLTFFLSRTKNYPAGFAHLAQGQEVTVEPLQRHVVGDNRKPLFILLTSVGLVLLIACANVANLQLARAASRRHETAINRVAGVWRKRIVRQLLVESLILSLLSAALGLLIAVVIPTFMIRHAQMPGVYERGQPLFANHANAGLAVWQIECFHQSGWLGTRLHCRDCIYDDCALGAPACNRRESHRPKERAAVCIAA